MLKCILDHATRDRRKLKKIPHKHNLYPSKWFERDHSRAKESIEGRQKLTTEHRYLIDYQHRCFHKSLHEVLTRHEVIYLIIRQRITNPHPTPRMYRHPSDMRRRNPSRSRHRHSNTMFLTIGDKTINEKSLPTPRRTSQQDILSHGKYLKCLVLIHCRQCIRKGGYGKTNLEFYFLNINKCSCMMRRKLLSFDFLTQNPVAWQLNWRFMISSLRTNPTFKNRSITRKARG